MKRSFTYVLTIIVLFAIAISCSKDDPPAAPSAVGTWKFTGYAATACTNAIDEETATCGGSTAECGTLVITASTYTNTPGSLTGGGSVETGSIVISGTTLTATPSGGSAMVFTFAVTATTLTLTREDAGTGCTETSTFTRQ